MNHPKKERTFVMVKHDGIQRSLVGEITKRIERTGLKLVAMKMLVPTLEKAAEHYAKDDAWCTKVGERMVSNLEKEGKEPTATTLEIGQKIREQLYGFFTSGPVVTMVWEGNQAIGVVKKIVGATEPLTSDVGTIRGDLTIDSYELANVDDRAVRNLVHCSDELDEAAREISVWFDDEELISYLHINEKMMYDVNLDGILE